MMGTYGRADADRPSRRTQERRRQRDLEFLEVLKKANAEELDRMVWESKRWPKWRRVAVARAVARLEAR
jgi:hypothetical protein